MRPDRDRFWCKCGQDNGDLLGALAYRGPCRQTRPILQFALQKLRRGGKTLRHILGNFLAPSRARLWVLFEDLSEPSLIPTYQPRKGRKLAISTNLSTRKCWNAMYQHESVEMQCMQERRLPLEDISGSEIFEIYSGREAFLKQSCRRHGHWPPVVIWIYMVILLSAPDMDSIYLAMLKVATSDF